MFSAKHSGIPVSRSAGFAGDARPGMTVNRGFLSRWRVHHAPRHRRFQFLHQL